MNEFDAIHASEPTEIKIQASFTADQARKRTSEALAREPEIAEYVKDIDQQIAIASGLGLSFTRPSCCCTNDRSALCSPLAASREQKAIGRHYEQLGFRCRVLSEGVMELSWPKVKPSGSRARKGMSTEDFHKAIEN